jgi:hypothetical protein
MHQPHYQAVFEKLLANKGQLRQGSGIGFFSAESA